MAKQPAAIIVGPIAKPSKPSVRLTAFDEPIITIIPHRKNNIPISIK